MSKRKVTIPDKFNLNETIMLRDISWAFLFPEEWYPYRQKASLRNTAKIKVIRVDDNDEYTVEMMEISPEEGRIVIPTRMTTKTTLKKIQVAIAYTIKSELS
jgi:hypothetical protein